MYQNNPNCMACRSSPFSNHKPWTDSYTQLPCKHVPNTNLTDYHDACSCPLNHGDVRPFGIECQAAVTRRAAKQIIHLVFGAVDRRPLCSLASGAFKRRKYR